MKEYHNAAEIKQMCFDILTELTDAPESAPLCQAYVMAYKDLLAKLNEEDHAAE